MAAKWKLNHALNIVCTELGFQDWEHARHVLGGQAKPTDDMGGLWYDFRCQLLLNNWFASYTEARVFCKHGATRFLFPYARQVVVGDENFVRMLGLDPKHRCGREPGAISSQAMARPPGAPSGICG